jgi:S1-C subfamily serine protease
MKKALFLLLLIIVLAASGAAAEKISAIESEIKIVLNQVAPSLVKVVAENSRKYVATGIALESELIITTALIASHPFEKLYVEDIHGTRISAVIAGKDERSGLSLLRLSRKGPPQLPQARQAGVGDWVALIGLFYNRFPAMSQGIISSLSEAELILNAPVAPGAAGGAVVNRKGELLGIIRGSIGFSRAPEYTFKDHSATIVVGGSKNESGGLCYALPMEKVRRIAAALKASGKIVYGWLGVSFSGDSSFVQAVEKGSPAQKAGIAQGDRIEEISGKPISGFRDIAAALQFGLAGDRIRITVSRDGKPMRLQAVLVERPSPPPPPEPAAFPEAPESVQGLLRQWSERLAGIPELSDLDTTLPRQKNYVIEFGGPRQLGIEIMELTGELSQKFQVKEGYGLLVSRVREASAAQKAGLQAGDILVRANGRSCRTAFDLRNVFKALAEGEALQLEVYRDGLLKKTSVIPDKNDLMDLKAFSEKMKNLQVRLDAKKLSEELRRLEAEIQRLDSDVKRKYDDQLRRIQQEIRKMQQAIEADVAGKNG